MPLCTDENPQRPAIIYVGHVVYVVQRGVSPGGDLVYSALCPGMGTKRLVIIQSMHSLESRRVPDSAWDKLSLY